MTRVKSITEDAEQFVVDFDDVAWGQPETVVIDKPSRTIRIVFKKKERGQQKVEGLNFDDIVSFRVELVGGGDSGSYFTILLETTVGRYFRLIPVSGTIFGLVKEDVVRDLFTKMNAYLPATRQLPVASKRLGTYPETSDGTSVANLGSNRAKVAAALLFVFIGLAIFTIVGGIAVISLGMAIEGYFVMAISIPMIYLAITATENKSIIIDTETRRLLVERCWFWCIRRRGKPVPFSDITGFEPFVLGQRCHVRMLRTGLLRPVTLLVTAYDSAEARGLVDWLQEHVPTGGSRGI